MAQNFGSPITDKTKEAREALRLALGLSTDVPFADYVNNLPSAGSELNPTDFFQEGQDGLWYEPYDITTLFQDALASKPVTSNGDPVSLIKDKSGNNRDAIQTVSSRRMTYLVSPPRLSLDKVDDEFVITIPTGGWNGTLLIATDLGTAAYEVVIPEGNYLLGGRYFPANAIVGVVFRQGGLTESEKASVISYFVSKGAVESYLNESEFKYFWGHWKIFTTFPLIDTSNVTDFSSAWSYCENLTSFPLLDSSNVTTFSSTWDYCKKLTNFSLLNTSSVTNFSYAWRGCIALTSFPLLDTSSATKFYFTWAYCSSLTSFPLLDTSKVTTFMYAWYDCTGLTSFPANMFDNVKTGDFKYSFNNTNLNTESIDGILTSLVTSGVATGTRQFNQSGGSAPSTTGEAAIDTLRSRGWAVNVTGGY